ncbi:MAG: methyltransferase domain-containing protein [Alphaproteobacteria bacterium]|nr:methyltransferase domain-containing protein [Alphaproteobacteria bacterium]MBV9371625.1 methyltransferase domain-containing protein [Alphaproteobacteria bacterium]MBV9901032.1 methyltransferase domain-containing protein [Alphaproteobacteria bacterium]
MDDRDYVLGTQDEEIERLGLQHRVWRDRMLGAWARAGLAPGMTVLDIGAGPGFAAVDLAEAVGPQGRVLALERSRRFLDSLEARAARLGLGNVEARECDVSDGPFGESVADAAWCRWVLSFVADPAATVRNLAAALKPGGVAIFHEYADYGAWRTMPPDPDVERFRTLVMQSWRDEGGEPDIALQLPSMLAAAGLETVEARPLIDIVRPGDFAWRWPAAFMAVNARRLRDLGYATADEAERFATALDRAGDGAMMITPLVAELIVRKPAGR